MCRVSELGLRLLARSLFLFYLRDEFRLELVEELEIEMVLRREGLLADDRLHRLHVLACKCARERWWKGERGV